MKHPVWQLQSPIEAIVFDCDGTLSHIEGIDELGRMNGVGDQVQHLTAMAMGQTGINAELFQQRLNLVQPTREQMITLAKAYIAQQTPDVKAVVQILQRLNKAVYIVSAGLLPAVADFGNYLSIPNDHIYAVAVDFDDQGNYQNFDQQSVLITNAGKRSIVQQLKRKHPSLVHVGDGLNDVSTVDIVTRFIGYGGAFYRENIAKLSHFYLHEQSLAPLLALCLTLKEAKLLTQDEQKIYNQGLLQLENIT